MPFPRFRPSPPAVVASAALLGAATGLRSQMGLAAVVVRSAPDRLPPILRSRPARLAAVAAAVGELVADKLPTAPDRTAPLGLGLRLGLAGLSAWLVGRSRGGGVILEVAAGATMAAATAFGGLAWRARLSRRFPPLAVALAEDGVSAALALVGFMTLRSD